MSLLGIDVGTGGCKAAVYAQDGRRLALAYREYAPLCPGPGLAELDSAAVLEKIWDAVAEVAAATGRDPVTALSVSSLGEAVTPVSAGREVLGRSILCSDARGGEYVDLVRRQLGEEAFYRINPNILGPNYSLPKLLWLRDHQPGLFRQTWKFLLWGDLVGFLLGAEAMTSFSLANRTLLLDIRTERWSEPLLNLAGLSADKLPSVAPSGAVAGQVSAAMARRLGLSAGAKIVVGGHDQSCNALGAGVFQPGRAVCGIGTFECITPVFGSIPPPADMLRARLNVEHHIIAGRYVSFLYNQAGSLVRWFRDTFAAADQTLAGHSDIYDALAAEMPAEPSRLLVLPYFEPTGAPTFVQDAAGMIVGLRTSTRRGEILRAIMEAAAFYFVGSLRVLAGMGIDTRELVATGGGAKSDAWLQIQADVLGLPFVRLADTECGVAGAAMLAGIATGVYAGPEEAAERFVRRTRVFAPDAARHEHYRRQHERYAELHPRMADMLRSLGSAGGY
ncbi:MAG: FGGY family carbohydrate kinase [Phycisphaerae bacterium]|nr:FGGY family carbohydrate kinase [Phycisphaerae bacterium]